MKQNLLVLIMFFSLQAYSQVYEEWVRRYNGFGNSADEYPKSAIDNNGNVYITGNSIGSTSGEDYVTIKYNSAGVEQWVQHYNGPGNNFDRSNAITVDNIGNVYVTGTSYAGPSPGTLSDYATIKYNTDGIIQWIQRYNGPGNGADDARAIAVDNSGNVFVTGWSDSTGTAMDYADYATLKYNSFGVLQWVRRYNGTGNGNDQATEIVIDNSGNVYVSGQSKGIGSDFDFATLKYNSNGVRQWVQRYNNVTNGWDAAYGITVDNSGNVYVTGISNGITTGFDFLTLKYNSSGILQWFKTFNGTQNEDDFCQSIQLDNSGNVVIFGTVQNVNSSYDFATIKYNSSGVLQWIKVYSGPGLSAVHSTDLKIDNSNNIYVTGYGYGNLFGANEDLITIKYNSSGIEEWLQNFDGSANDDDITPSIELDNQGYIYISATSIGSSSGRDIVTIKYSPNLFVEQPIPYTKWISGYTSTIQWIGWSRVNIKCQVNSGTASQADSIIVLDTNLNQTEYHWDIPDNFLSFRSKIIIENASNPTQKIESGIFRIKPYLLTRVDVVSSDSIYYEYKKERDQWGFWNEESQMFGPDWYDQFDYQGIDPFTGITYPQWQGFGAFQLAESKNFEDWISWVNTFTINECYWNTTLGIYKLWKVLIWSINKKKKWDGSCFGLAVSNGLVFRNKVEFQNKYQNFPQFSQPFNVTSNNEVRKIINELFTYQFGEPHQSYRNNIGFNKTPKQTLNEIKSMLLSEDDPLKALSFFKNPPSAGGHTVIPYLVKQDVNNSDIYYIYIYDNKYHTSMNPIKINISHNGGNGSWSSPDWNGWGGDRYIFLEDPVQTYLTNPTDAENINNKTGLNTVQILNSKNYSYSIKDIYGNISGYVNDSLKLNILNSYPLIYLDGSEGAPYGFVLPNADYRVELKDFLEDTIQAVIFIGNKAFSYERYDADTSQTDKIYFNNGLSVVNADPENKTISLLNIHDETAHEKLFAFSSLEMSQNDSIKIETLDSDNFKLISYGSTKSYDIELNFGSQTQLGRFLNVNIDLPSNSSHTFIPDWNNVTTSQLIILEDIGNNGTIDDTLRLINIITNSEEGFVSLPDKYFLAQNYPNPFNPLTLIKYEIKNDGMVTLKVCNILGKEVASLVNEIKRAGRYEVEFNGSNLSSGIYYYRLESGEYREARKMLLLK